MRIDFHRDDQDIASPLPVTPFLARQHSTTGPLCIVSLCSGISPPCYSVMFLQGTGGPAIGDVLSPLKHEQIITQFIPLRQPVTLTNQWR